MRRAAGTCGRRARRPRRRHPRRRGLRRKVRKARSRWIRRGVSRRRRARAPPPSARTAPRFSPGDGSPDRDREGANDEGRVSTRARSGAPSRRLARRNTTSRRVPWKLFALDVGRARGSPERVDTVKCARPRRMPVPRGDAGHRRASAPATSSARSTAAASLRSDERSRPRSARSYRRFRRARADHTLARRRQ